MKLIIGLGNPGPKYKSTRHNAGFMVVDLLAKSLKVKFKDTPRLDSEVAETEDLILAKPTTFVNNSGRAVSKLIHKYGLSAADILVVYDDVDTVLGSVRLRQKGSSGGHNGIKSIIATIGEDFKRLKIGVGKHPTTDTADFVLEKMSPKELDELAPSITQAVDRIEKWDI